MRPLAASFAPILLVFRGPVLLRTTHRFLGGGFGMDFLIRKFILLVLRGPVLLRTAHRLLGGGFGMEFLIRRRKWCQVHALQKKK